MPHRLPLEQLAPRRVCIIKPSALGDVVQTLPVLAGLAARWPEAQFSWVVNRSLAGILAGHPQLHEVIAFDRGARGWHRWKSMPGFVKALCGAKFELVIDLQGLLRSGAMAWVTRAPRRIGYAQPREPAARWAYTDTIALPAKNLPAVPKYWRVAQALGCTGAPPAAHLGITPELHVWAAAQLAVLPAPRLAIHPGAQWTTKRWPPEHFAELARRAQREFNAGIVLVGGPGDGMLCDRIAASLTGPCVNLAEKTNLLELAAVSAAADVFLAGDTGPMHLAAAVGTPVVAVYTCTSPERAGPHGVGHRVVATRVDCAASYLRTCPTLHCMQELSPGRVWPALCAALVEADTPTRRAAS
jgi:lipopolysaccharide heptosyltransferase I